MKDNISEINKEIMQLCELMGIDQKQIRYVMISGAEFIGETLTIDYEGIDLDDTIAIEDLSKNETTYFHPMKINVEMDVTEDGHLCSTKYFSALNPYSDQPYSTFKNYNILTQSPIYPDLMLEYLKVVYNTYFAEEVPTAIPLLLAPVRKNNIVNIKDYKKKK